MACVGPEPRSDPIKGRMLIIRPSVEATVSWGMTSEIMIMSFTLHLSLQAPMKTSPLQSPAPSLRETL